MASFKQIEKYNWEVTFYCKQYDGTNKKIRKRGFRTKKEASEYVSSYISKQSGTADIMFFDLLDEFIKYKQDKVKFNTFLSYKKFKKNILKYFRNKPLNEITKSDLARFLDKIQASTTQKEVKNKLNLIFKYANTYYNFPNNPMQNLNYELKKHISKIKNILTFEEFKQFDNIIKNRNDIITRLYFNFLYYSGARPGEISALTLSDIDFKNNTIDINKTRLRSKKTNSPKNNSSIRIVSMPSFLMKELQKILKNYPKNEFIFKTTINYNEILNKIIKENNFKKITLHCFRHSHVSYLIEKGIEITAISKRIGHKNSQITLSIYAHFYKTKSDKIIDILENDAIEQF